MGAAAERLALVEARLDQLKEKDTADYDVVVKGVEAVWAAVLSEQVAGVTEIEATQERLWPRIHAAMDAVGSNGPGRRLPSRSPPTIRPGRPSRRRRYRFRMER